MYDRGMGANADVTLSKVCGSVEMPEMCDYVMVEAAVVLLLVAEVVVAFSGEL
jgi:hypothetical protein